MSESLLDCVEIEPRTPARRAVIWLHGLGADGHDFEPVVPLLGVPDDAAVRFVFPNAPVRPVTLNYGMAMRAWYDVAALDEERHYDDEDILASTAQIEALIARERARGIAAADIVLAGFSQGGAVALHAGLRHAERLAGIVALSTYLLRGETLEVEAAPANRDVPIFQAHGTHDPVVLPKWGRAAHERLEELGYAVTFRLYPMEHQVVMEEIEEIGAFLRACFGLEERSA